MSLQPRTRAGVRNVIHNTFSLERVYPASPRRVFAAFATLEAKSVWFGAPEEWGQDQQTLDFRVGGQETSVGGPPGGPVHAMLAIYQDIVPNERIVYTYDILVGGARISVSLATIELLPEGKGTHLILTEQGVYLDGHDTPEERIHGMGILLDALGVALENHPALA
jgi:uncharacterized protein YndB with AHSA1/START domain